MELVEHVVSFEVFHLILYWHLSFCIGSYRALPKQDVAYLPVKS